MRCTSNIVDTLAEIKAFSHFFIFEAVSNLTASKKSQTRVDISKDKTTWMSPHSAIDQSAV